jgi:hypothetical protein
MDLQGRFDCSGVLVGGWLTTHFQTVLPSCARKREPGEALKKQKHPDSLVQGLGRSLPRVEWFG